MLEFLRLCSWDDIPVLDDAVIASRLKVSAMHTRARAHTHTPAVFHAEHLNHRQENYSHDCTVYIEYCFCVLTPRALV